MLAIIPLNLDGSLFDDTSPRSITKTLRRRSAPDFVDWNKDIRKFRRQVERVAAALRSDSNARTKPPEPQL